MKKGKPESNNVKYEIRPASSEEAGLFYAMPPEKDAELGCIGHVRIDFGSRGNGFYHTWHARGPEELNTQDFKKDLAKVMDEMRQGVLKNLAAMTGYCRGHGGEIDGGWVQNYGYVVETENYRYCLRCNPVPDDYQAYLTCFDKQVQEMNQSGRKKQEDRKELEIKDIFGKTVTLIPKVELYSVRDFMGKEMPGLALDLYMVDEEYGGLEPYATLTKSFGEFISIKNSAYIDTNNCYFADQLLGQGIAEATPLKKGSGFCIYPLWVFKEEFLQQIGGEKYQEYVRAYDQYMGQSEDETMDPEEPDRSQEMGGME